VETGDARPAFTYPAFRSLLRAEYIATSDRTATALRGGIPTLTEAPDVAVAWVYGLYATVLARLPDAGGLETFSTSIRNGLAPADACRSLARSVEGVRTGAADPADLHEVFVTGAYITAMGRAPDEVGMATHVEVLRKGGSPETVLQALLNSAEAKRSMRFPPAPISRGHLIADSMQVILLSRRVPDPYLTHLYGIAYNDGATTRQVAKLMLRRDRRPRGIVRSFLLTRTLIRLIEVDATARGAQLEALANRRWQWRVARKNARRLDRIAASLEQIAPNTDGRRVSIGGGGK
jgi:hypothetical protein